MTQMLEKITEAAYQALHDPSVAVVDRCIGPYRARPRPDDFTLDPEPSPSLTLVDADIDLTALVRAILAAMREPDEAMRDASYAASGDASADAWPAMIDSILLDTTA